MIVFPNQKGPNDSIFVTNFEHHLYVRLKVKSIYYLVFRNILFLNRNHSSIHRTARDTPDRVSLAVCVVSVFAFDDIPWRLELKF